MNIVRFIFVAMVLAGFGCVQAQRTLLDRFIDEYRSLRYKVLDLIKRTDTDSSYLMNSEREKVQKPLPETTQFFCDTKNGPGARSVSVPESVHCLRPGDIDVIAAIGDSLTAGNGALAQTIPQVLIENKGVSWSIGGQGNWRKYLTLPNIIKEFNPKLYGYSVSDGLSTDKVSRFNVAEIGAMSRDIPHEAEVLVQRMTNDQNVNVKKDWKMVTILIGPNDFCLDFCYQKNPEGSIENHQKELIDTLRILRDNLPRLIVNLVTPPSMKVIYHLRGKPNECQAINHFECPCVFSSKYDEMRQQYFRIMEKWQQTVEDVAELDEFHRNDFTVINQPFLKFVQFPLKSNGVHHDFTYMSADCFHLSQKGYALASNALWNNILEPVGNKSTNWRKEFENFRCPTEEKPYIFTRMNSAQLVDL